MIDFKLIKMRIFNFACYYGENIIDFTSKNQKNIFLFKLRNGDGKTSLFHAIKWGFYGESIEYYKDSTKVDVKDFLNNRLDSKKDHFFVEITFECDNENYILNRKYYDNANKVSTFSLQKDGRLITDSEIAQEILDSIIPLNFADFFMFDGEKLSNFMTAQKELSYRDSIHQLLGLKQLRVLHDDLEKLQDRYENKLTQQTSTNQVVNSKKEVIQGLKTQIEGYNTKIGLQQVEIQKNVELIEGLDAKRTEYENLPKVMDDLAKIYDKREKLNAEIGKIRNRLMINSKLLFVTFIKKDLQSFVSGNADSLTELESISGLTEHEANAQATRENILRNSIPVCNVCQHKLTSDELKALKSEQKKIEEAIKIFSKNKKKMDEIKDENSVFNSFIRITEEFNYQKDLDDLYDKESLLKDNNNRKEELELESRKNEYGTLGGINRQISQLELTNTTKLAQINVMKQKIKTLCVQKDDITADIKRLGHDDKITEKMSALSIYVTKLKKHLNEALESGTATKRSNIIKKSNHLFLQITNKPEEYKGIEFEDENSYSFVIKTKDNKIVMNPSKGEKQVLAMSFLLGLNQYTGRNNVILMDTPVASLDDIHSAGIGKALAGLNNQVIFLAQPQELQGKIYTNMKPAVAKEFLVTRTNYKSKIEEVN